MSNIQRNHVESVEEEQENLSRLGFNFLAKEPFYAHIMGGINKYVIDSDEMSEVSEIHPMSISNIKILFNYKKWEPLTNKQKLQRFKHEVLHYVFLHPWSEVPDNKGLFYTACDLVVNLHTSDDTSINVKYFDYLVNTYKSYLDTGDGNIPCYNSLVDLYNSISKSIEKKHLGDPEGLDAEIIMWQKKALVGDIYTDESKSEFNEAIAFFPKNTEGDPNISEISSAIKDALGNGGSPSDVEAAIGDILDNPKDPWKSVKNNTSESAASEVLKNALNEAKNRGTLPGSLQEYADMLLSDPKIDWKKHVRAFTKRAGKVTLGTTMSKKSKKWGTYPASKITKLQRLAIAIDTSGSMSDEEFKQAMSEVRGVLQRNATCVVIQADSEVDDVTLYEGRLPELTRVCRSGFGGTSFDDPLKYVKTKGRLDEHSEFPNIGDVDGLIYITDGYAPAPDLENYPKCKVMWLTTQKSVSQMEEEGFKGMILKLEVDGMNQ